MLRVSRSPIVNQSGCPKRRAVTIIAGFRSHQGVVVCADTQETIGEIFKHNVPKLRFEPSGAQAAARRVLGSANDDDLAVAFCGATNNGPYLDMLIDKAWEAAREAVSLAEACTLIEESIKDTHQEYGGIYQTGYLPVTEVIYGVKMERDSKLFYALGPAITEKTGYICGGQGAYLANFLAKRMHGDGLSIRQCIIIAAYVLFQAKEHVEGCGGDSHIAVLRNEGTSGRVHWENVEAITKLVENSDKQVGEILMQHANLALTKEQFVEQAREVIDLMAVLREHGRQELQQQKEMWDGIFGIALHDEIGLPTPAVPNSSVTDGILDAAEPTADGETDNPDE